MRPESGWLRGCSTAIVTPFDASGEVDDVRLAALVERQIVGGIGTIVVAGTTGEGATLTDDEVLRVTVTAISAARGHARVVVGTGGNATAKVVEATRRARDAGADGALVVSPYYNKPTQAGLVAHFGAVAEAVPGFPVILYNVPTRTASNLLPESVLEIARAHQNVVAIKEASGTVTQPAAILRDAPEGFRVLSGDDALALATIALGAEGVVSVVSNQAPGLMSGLVERSLAGDWAGARALHYILLPLMEANFLETNPAPVKATLDMLGLAEDRLRLPLVSVSAATRERLRIALAAAGLVETGESRRHVAA